MATHRDLLARIEFGAAALAVFFSPMNFLRAPGFYFTLADVFLLLALTLGLLVRPLPLRHFGWATPLYLGGLALLLGGLLMSSLLAGDPVRGMIVFAQYAVALLVVPVVLLGRPARQVVILVSVLVASVCLMVVHGIYVVESGETNTRFVSGSGRLRGFVERSNEAAALIAITLPLLLWLVRTRRLPVLAGLPLAVLLLYGILLAGSNTGLFAAVAASAIFVVGTTSPVRSMLVIGAVTVAAITVVSFGRDNLPKVFQERVLSALESGDLRAAGTFQGRVALAEEAFVLTEETWIVGFGADQFRVRSSHGAPVHNAYLLVWTEGGVAALVGLLLVLTAVVAACLPAVRDRRWRPAGMAALAIGLTFALLINGTPHVYGRFWVFPLFLGLAIALAKAGMAQRSSALAPVSALRPPRSAARG